MIKKKFLILFLLISSFFIFSKGVSAIANAPVSPDYLNYFNINFTNDLNSNHSKYFQKFYNLFEANKNEYPYYMIIYQGNNYNAKFRMFVFDKIPNYYLYYYTATSGGARQMFYNPYDQAPDFKYRDVTTGSTLSSPHSNFSWNTIYSDYSWASIVIFDSNFPIQLISSYNSCGGCSGRRGIDLKIDDLYYTYGDIIPTYSEYDPTIKKMYYSVDPKVNYKLNENTTIIDDVTYTTSNDVTITVDNFNSTKHLYQYQFVKKDGEISDNWITHDLTSNNSFTLNFKENGTIVSRILDKTNNKQILSNTYTFDNITLSKDTIDIDTTNLSYIKIKFDVTDDIPNNYQHTILQNLSKPLKEAYIEQTFADSCVGNSCQDIWHSRDMLSYNELLNAYFSSTSLNSNNYILTNYEIYFDVSDISSVVTLSVESKSNFTIEYGYLEDYIDNSITLNLNGYSGLVLYPKVSNYNGNYPFYLDNADINIFEYKNNSLVSYYKNITSKSFSIKNLHNYEKTRYFIIHNNKITEDSYITFDTRYFNHQLILNTEDETTIVNPNYGFDTTIPSIDDADFQKDFIDILGDNDFHSIIDYMRSLLDDLEETSQAFNTIFHSFYDNLPNIVQVGLVCGYILLLIIVALKIGGWNND